MRRILLALLLILTSAPALALKFFHKKPPQLLVINENILIEGKFTNSQKTEAIAPPPLDLRIAINIPHDQKYLTITTLYDEINENPIEQITWVVDNGKKKPATKIKAYKIDQIINQNIESLAMEYNPTLAYDRIHHNKHIINKTFYFDQAAIFGDKTKAPTQFLELYMPEAKGIKTKGIRIDQDLYQAQTQQAISTNNKKIFQKPIFHKQEKQQVPINPLPQAEPDDTADIENAKQQINSFNANTANPNTLNSNDQEQQQLQQMQQQMQLDSIQNEDFYGEEDEDENPF